MTDPSPPPAQPPAQKGLTYKQAGVDIAAGNRLVDYIRPLAARTRRPGAGAAIGGFGALFDPKAAGFTDPLILTSTDGVGTKLRLALKLRQHQTIGIDLVAMCANDLIVQGATPLLFLDYYACGKLQPDIAQNVLKGIVEGCMLAGCALGGGETAEMPGHYQADDYDLAGFILGAVERDQILTPERVQPGDVIIGLESSGPHANGFSLIHKIIEQAGVDVTAPAPASWNSTYSLGEVLLTPTRIYVKQVLELLSAFPTAIHGICHITGGGIEENLPRILPAGLMAQIQMPPLPPVFSWLQQKGHVPLADFRRTFNCGFGLLLVVAPDQQADVLSRLSALGEDPEVLGTIQPAAQKTDRPAVSFS